MPVTAGAPAIIWSYMITFFYEKKQVAATAPIPASLIQYTIPGAKHLYTAGDYGTVVVNEIKRPLFTIIDKHYLIDKNNSTVVYACAEPALVLHVNLRSGLQFTPEGQPETILPQGQFNFGYAPSGNTKAFFKKAGLHHHCLSICFKPAFLAPYRAPYPELSAFLSSTETVRPGWLSPAPMSATPEIISLANRLLQPPGTPEISGEFLQWQVTELLLLALEKINANLALPWLSVITPSDMEKLHQGAAYLLAHPEEYSGLKKFSLKMGINMFKLKKGFRLLYHSGVYQYAAAARMNKAKQLLLGSQLPVEDIAEEVGYKNVASFSTAFKRNTGDTPTAFREKSRGTAFHDKDQ